MTDTDIKIQSRTFIVDLLEHFKLPLIAAEIGVAEGRYSSELLHTGIEEIYLVDIWNHIPQWEGCAGFEQGWHNINLWKVKNLFEGKENVHILRGFSKDVCNEVPDNSLGLVYLDADHAYNSVLTDLTCWFPKLVKGGIMAGHDYRNPTYGVMQAVQDFTKDKYVVHQIDEDGNLDNMGFWFQKELK